MREALVSIIVSFYNEERFLGKCIQSVLDSSYQNFELILVNDASTDSSEEVVKSFSDTRIKYIKVNRNQGQTHGRNEGLNVAKGDYIGFFDGDDILDKEKIRRQVKYLNDNPEIVLVSGSYAQIDIEDNIVIPKVSVRHFDDMSIRVHMLFENCIPCGGGALFRKCVVDEYNIRNDENLRDTEDYKFFVDCLECGKVANIDDVLFYYRHDDSYISQTRKLMSAREKTRDMEMISLFLYAWNKRGINLNEKEARMIYRNFYDKKRFKYSDVYKSKKIKHKIANSNIQEKEKKEILRVYEEIEKHRMPKPVILRMKNECNRRFNNNSAL